MSEYVIFTDANSDMDAGMVERWGVEVLPMRFAIGGAEYYNWPDKREMTSEEFYKKIRNGDMSSTTQTNAIEFEELFRPHLQAGRDVLYIGFSSGLSGTLHAAQMAAETLKEELPGGRVVVVDTLSICLGQALLVEAAAKLKNEGKTLDEVAAWVEENRLKVSHLFTVDDLNFLKRGGRLSGTAALVGTVLSIKPVLKVNTEGRLVVDDKVRGRKNSLMRLADEVEKTAANPKENTIYVAHADNLADAELVAEEIRNRTGAANVECKYIGPVLGGHTGPDAIAVLFFSNGRE